MSETAQAEEQKIDNQQPQSSDDKTQAKSVELSQVSEDKSTGPGSSIDLLLDMEVPVSVVIGQTEIPIQRFLQLSPGSILKIEKPVETPVDLYLKDIRFATGDIVIVEDKFAVRIKEVIVSSPPAANKK